MSKGVKGSLIGLKINGVFVSCETSCEFNFDTEMLPASAITSGRWKEFLAGLRSWTMVVNGNLLLQSVGADIKKVLQAVITGEMLEVSFATKTGADTPYSISGEALPQNGNIIAPSVGKANWMVTFQGSGPITIATDDVPPSAPTGLYSPGNSANTINLAWLASTDNNGSIASYRIYIDGVFKMSSPVNSAIVTGLTPVTSYTFTVTAVDSSGNESLPSDPMTTNTSN